MHRLRRLGFALWIALALLVGQQAAALHDLGHATSQLSEKGGKPASPVCDQCFLGAQLAGAVGATPPALLLAATVDVGPPALPAARVIAAAAPPFRSRAPPVRS